MMALPACGDKSAGPGSTPREVLPHEPVRSMLCLVPSYPRGESRRPGPVRPDAIPVLARPASRKDVVVGSGLFQMRRLDVTGAPGHSGEVDVLVVLENDVTRFGITTMLGQVSAAHTVVACATAAEAADWLSGHTAHLVVLADGELQRGAERMIPIATEAGVKVLLLLETGSQNQINRVVLAAPDGIILQSELTVAKLEDAILRVVRGELPIPPSVARELLVRARDNRATGPTGRSLEALLTPRERQALDLLAEGLSNKQIARRLGISDNSAKRHVGNVLAKLNCPNRTFAVARALQAGLIDEANNRSPG